MISVIIPSGRPERLPALLESLRSQAVDDSIEILVATPKQASPISLCGARIVETDRLYAPGRMRNAGAAASSGEVLFFIDDDCMPSSDCMKVLKAKLLEADTNGAVGCRVSGRPESFWTTCADYCLFSAYQLPKEMPVDLGSAALAVKRTAFESVGGFDEKLLASEDWDFSLKLRARGWRCIFDPSVEVLHEHRRGSPGSIMRQSFSSGFESGLDVQRRYYDMMSLPARIAVKCRSPWLYWLVILPYAALVTLSMFAIALRRDSRALLFLPMLTGSRLLYQCGVMKRLTLDRC